jgi:1-acyl-sn-glycerol-3-phosphate acyltransferase
MPIEIETVIDLSIAPWLTDHRPTYSLPALPMMSVADLIASDAQKLFPDLKVIELQDLQMERWILFDEAPVRLKNSLRVLDDETLEVTLFMWREAATQALSRFEPVARSKVLLATEYPLAPDPMPPIPGLEQIPTPYEERRLFHGPAFQQLLQLSLSPHGSSALLNASSHSVPVGNLSPALLDAALHGIPHDRLSFWCSAIGDGFVAYPNRVIRARFYMSTPTNGTVLCNARFTGLPKARRPNFRLELLVNRQPWAILEIAEMLFPLGNLGSVPPVMREAFLTHQYAPFVSMARFEDNVTYLSDREIQELGWMPGTLSHVYAINKNTADVTKEITIKDHVARSARVHPSLVTVGNDFSSARAATQPLLTFPLIVTREHNNVSVRTAGLPSLKLDALLDSWVERLGVGSWVLPDLFFSLAARFIRNLVVANPVEFSKVRGRGLIFAANHQVAIESMMFKSIVSPLAQSRMSILSRIENQNSWLGQLARFFNIYPGVNDAFDLVLFDRKDHASLLQIMEKLERDLLQGVSVLVHIEGTQALAARHPVTKMSSVFADLAHRTKAPIVPIRFAGALPISPVDTEIQFPIGFSKQDFYVGRPILSEELESLPYAKRRSAVLDAINALGPPLEQELPNPGDPEFANAVAGSIRFEGFTPERAVLVEVLENALYSGSQTESINEARKTRRLAVDPDDRGRWLAEFARWLLGEIEVTWKSS